MQKYLLGLTFADLRAAVRLACLILRIALVSAIVLIIVAFVFMALFSQ
jgi:hypothetical protein